MKETFNFPHTRVDEFLLDIIDKGLKAGLSGDLSDSRTHGAGAEDGDFFSWVGHDFFV